MARIGAWVLYCIAIGIIYELPGNWETPAPAWFVLLSVGVIILIIKYVKE